MIKFRLKVLLAEHEMTQKELAIKTGIQPNTISKICTNTIVQIPVDVIDKICLYFNCDISELIKVVKEEND